MSVMRYFALNSLIRLGTFALGALAAFVVTPHVLASLHPPTYGAWSLISSLLVYYILVDCGLIKAVSTFFARASVRGDHEAMTSICATASRLNLAGGVLVFVAGIIGSLLARFFVGAEVDTDAASWAIFIFSTAMAVHVSCRVFHGLIIAELLWTPLALLGMGKILATSAATLLWLDTSLSPAANLIRVAIIASCGSLLEDAGLCALSWPYWRGRIRKGIFSKTRALELLRFGALVLITDVGTVLRSYTQIFIVATMLGLIQTAIFSIARQFINYMGNAMMGAFGIMDPYFSRMRSTGESWECKNPLILSLCLSYTSGCTIALCLCFYSGLFIARWVGPDFTAAQDVLIPLALAGMLDFGQYPANGFLQGLGRHQILAGLSLVEGALITLLGFPAVWLWGMPGIGWLVFVLAVITRVVILPGRVCRVAELAPRAFYVNVGGALALQIVGQILYYYTIRSLLSPNYPVIGLACTGQFVVACLLFSIHIRTVNRRFSDSGPATAK